ncbi:MAG: bifunctional hydroxymethylpyrimidine kinase/phosphomethylpyrimidine kinase [Myxococcota bacterium]
MSDFISNMMQPEQEEPLHPVATTVAGSDSGGGAGIQADLKTFAALGVHGTSVLTLVTAQNTRGVDGLQMLPAEAVRRQYKAIMSDFEVDASKTGALGNAEMIGVVLECIQDDPVDKLVVDPVMVSKHGDPLMVEEAQQLIRDELLEHAFLVTPNPHEAEILSGRSVGGPDTMKEAAKRIFDHGPQHVLVKGSHLDKVVRDILYDGTGFIEYGADRISNERVHGSGCVHSAAITARLALGDSLEDAVGFARKFISRAIETAPKVGGGIQPVNPMHEVWE